MEISKSLEQSALDSIIAANDSQDLIESQNNLIEIGSSCFFVTTTGEGIIPHGDVVYNGVKYYIGTREED